MDALAAAASGMFGLVAGSFLNVVIHRVPRNESVVAPRSRCPACETQLRSIDNIPVVSWLLLRGRCRTCQAAISARYPLIELSCSVLFVALAIRFGASWTLPPMLVLGGALVAITAIDLELRIVPRKIVYVAAAAGCGLFAWAAGVESSWGDLGRAVAAGLAGFAVLFAIHLASPRGMGFGDVRLAGLLGLHLGWLSWGHLALGLFLGFVLGAVFGIALAAGGRAGRKTAVPFAPFLAAGALLSLLVGDPLLDRYPPLADAAPLPSRLSTPVTGVHVVTGVPAVTGVTGVAVVTDVV